MGMGETLGNALVDALVNQANHTADTAVWLSLHTADPGDTGASEADDATYGRVDVTAKFGAADAMEALNDAVIEFAALTTGGTYTHYGLWTAETTGTFRFGGDITPDKAVGAGEILRFAVGQLSVSMAGAYA